MHKTLVILKHFNINFGIVSFRRIVPFQLIQLLLNFFQLLSHVYSRK